MAYVIAVIGGLAFGAADQYLGTLRMSSLLGPWVSTASGVSAPWLVLPFLVGATQERPRRAMALGIVVTCAALVGYFAMSHSPMEGAPIKDFFHRVVTMMRTGYNPIWIAGGLASGPLFGYLGHRWRVGRSWISAALVAASLCFEPLARAFAGMLNGPAVVWGVEAAIGAVAAAAFAYVIATSRRARETVPPSTG